MSIRPHPKDPGIWIIDYRPNGRKGKRVRVPFMGTQEEATQAEHDLRIRAKGDREIFLYPKVSEVIPEYMQWYGLDHQPGGTERTNRSIKHLLRYFGSYQFTSITDQMIEYYKRDRLKDVKPTTINKELAALSKLCKWAKKKRYCKEIPQVERFPEKLTKSPFPHVPNQEDIEKLIAAIPWPKQGIFYCLYYGGLRKHEAGGLTVEMVNMSQKTLTIRGKGNKQRIVPILKYLEPILERRLREVKTGLLWATQSGVPLYDLRGTILWASKRAGIKTYITPHSLRHAFGVRAVMAGIHLRTIQLILGHSSSKVTELYTHLAAGQIAEEMERF
jgi:integrase/recombinase XerD